MVILMSVFFVSLGFFHVIQVNEFGALWVFLWLEYPHFILGKALKLEYLEIHASGHVQQC